MTDRRPRQPSAEHPITITPTGRRVTVSVGGVQIAQTDDALTLQEASYPPVQYIPLADVDPTALACSATTTYCPYKGDATYYHVHDVHDVIWTYEHPYPAVAQIVGRVAFYPDKARIELA
ncbi:DUF427 domain-containing protein [Mycobacterium sp. NPDC003323]